MHKRWQLIDSMRDKFQILWALVLIISTCNAQESKDEKCVRTKHLTYGVILKEFPFSKASAVTIISFKTIGDEVKWEIPRTNGKIDSKKFFESKTLSKPQREELFDLLINYNYDPQFDGDIKVNLCYNPRNAILFSDGKGKVISYVEICFECLQIKTEPKNLQLGDFCLDKWDKLKAFFKKVGVDFGTNQWDQ
jgi:hypothetical protein